MRLGLALAAAVVGRGLAATAAEFVIPDVAPLSAMPSASPGARALPALPALPAAAVSAEPALRPLPRDAAAQARFFFNEHDLAPHYRAALGHFVRDIDRLILEGVRSRREQALFQAVSDGRMSPAQAAWRLRGRALDRGIDSAVLQALAGTKVRVSREPIALSRYRASDARRRRLDAEASKWAGEAEDLFLEGDAEAAAGMLRRANASLAQIHALREAAYVEEIGRRLDRREGRIGIMLGLFHTRVADALRRQGRSVAAEFHPEVARPYPFTRPLQKAMEGRGYSNQTREKKDLVSGLLLYWTLRDRYRAEAPPKGKGRVFSAIVRRMSWSDMKRLARAVSEMRVDARVEPSVAARSSFVLRWLLDEGFLKPAESKLFRMGR